VLAALAQCFMLTWIALNKRSQIPLKSWESTGESVLDKTKDGLVFTSFKISVTLKTDAARVEEARKLLDLAKKHCIIANALKTPATLDAVVEAA
jgi:organic hydroperoxide reductase OsmC/OhrA